MPVHTVIGSDGKTYRVKVPKGVTQEQVANRLMKKLRPTQSELGRRRGGAVAQGALLGWGDEISSGMAAGMAKIAGDKKPFKDIYSDILETEQAEQNRYADENLGENLALQLGGGLATGSMGVRRLLPKSLTGAKGVAANLAAATTEAGIAGAGAANPEERGEGALKGAALGGLTSAGLSTLGGIGKVISNRRVQEPLRQGDKFVPLNVADSENPIGSFYRNFLGRTWGAGKDLQHQTQKLIDPLQGQYDDATRAASALKETLGRQEEAIKEGVKQSTRRGIDRVKGRVPDFGRLRAQAAERSLPEAAGELREVVKNMSPAAATMKMREWWNREGFKEIKGMQFALTDDMLGPVAIIRNELQENPSFRLEMGDVAERITAMAKNLKGGQQAPDVLDGEALMAIRNAFAMPSNKASEGFKKMAQRGVVSKIDDAITSQADMIDPGIAARFQEQKDAYKTFSIFRTAAKKAFKSKQSYFDEDDWLAAVERRVGPNPDAYLVGQANMTQTAADAADEAAKRIKENQPKVLKSAVAKLGAKQKLGDAKQKADAAKLELLEMARKSPNPNATGLSELLTTSTMGRQLIPDKAPFGLGQSVGAAILVGSGAAKGLASETGQELVAGQTAWQQALAKQLRDREEQLRALNAAASRAAALQTGE